MENMGSYGEKYGDYMGIKGLIIWGVSRGMKRKRGCVDAGGPDRFVALTTGILYGTVVSQWGSWLSNYYRGSDIWI